MISMKRERGLTMISWLLIFVMVGAFIMVGMKIGPVYLDHYSIKTIVKSLGQEPLISRKPVHEIRSMLFSRFDINNIRHLHKDNVTIRRSGGVTEIEVKYEERRNIVGNLDAVMSFQDSIKLIAN